MANTTGKGGFSKGKSGNPGGRPSKDERLRHAEQLAREHTVEAIAALIDEAKNGKGASRVSAAIAVLDRGWGKAVERQESGDPGSFAQDMTDDQLDSEIKETVELAIKSGTARALKIVKAA